MDERAATAPRRWGDPATGKREPLRWVDLLVMLGIGGAIFAVVDTAQEWTGALRETVAIDLSPSALPGYTLLSLCRGLAAFALSFAFTIGYGYWAAKDKVAGRILIPLLDVLQSIPVLGFMPGLVLALVAAFPHSNTGLEIASILMIFTGQVWNMTFSFYHSLKSVPEDLTEAASLFRFSAWSRLYRVELPFATIGLVWNGMMSMAGGWFFLMISEAFVLGDRDFRLPGLGSYMSVAAARGDNWAMVWAVLAMTLMIVALDQLFWRPMVVWSQRFRVEDSGQQAPMRSWFLERLRRSGVLAFVAALVRRPFSSRTRPRTAPATVARKERGRAAKVASRAVFVAMVAAMAFGSWRLVMLLLPVSASQWWDIGTGGAMTLGRVLLSTAMGTAWALPAGLAIGLSPRLSRVLQPVVQVVASFPAPMLFPAVVALLHALGVSLGWGSIALMLLGTQWYILFNVVAGATAIPADLREAAQLFHYGRMQRFTSLYLPAVFPYLVTGWVTAAGGAWNASIVAEHVEFRGDTLTTQGLGALVSDAATAARFPQLAASLVAMSAIVVLFNRIVWRRLHALAERRFALTR